MQHIELSDREIEDLLQAIYGAQDELCIGPRWPQATAFNQRLDQLAAKLKAAHRLGSCEPAD